MPPKEPPTRPRTLKKGKDEARKQGLITGFMPLKPGRPPLSPAKPAATPAKRDAICIANAASLPHKKRKGTYTDWTLEANKMALEAAVKEKIDGLQQSD
jgi:hypothetical protein